MRAGLLEQVPHLWPRPMPQRFRLFPGGGVAQALIPNVLVSPSLEGSGVGGCEYQRNSIVVCCKAAVVVCKCCRRIGDCISGMGLAHTIARRHPIRWIIGPSQADLSFCRAGAEGSSLPSSCVGRPRVVIHYLHPRRPSEV